MNSINREVIACKKCPRLVKWREKVAREKRASFANEKYWGKPVPSFGEEQPKILIVGLAPAAHGANRTGRMFTGDRSGDWLYRALHNNGLANQATAKNRNDGLKLKSTYITAVVRCAPPDNKPSTVERDRCLPYLKREFEKMKKAQVVVCLGGFAWDNTLRTLSELGHSAKPKPKFGHGAHAQIGPYHLLGSFHPSQQNTFTKRLTEPMLDEVFETAKRLSLL